MTKFTRNILALALGIALGAACTASQATGPAPSAVSSSGAVAGAVAGASAGAASSATGSVTGSASAGGSQSSVDSKAFGFGAPSSSNSINNCEVTLPFIGGSGIEEREACAVIRDSRALYDMVPVDQERDAAVKARLCASEKIEKAFAVTKRPCLSR